MSDKAVQQAWREKMALVVLIFCACLLLAFLTFGLTKVVCSREDRRVFMINEVKALTVSSAPHSFSLRGHIYDLKPYLTEHMNFRAFQVLTPADREAFLRLVGIDITMMFPPDGSSCRGVASGQFRLTCQSPDFPKVPYCHDELKSMPILDRLRVGEVRYPWEWLAESKDHLVYNGKVLNMSLYLSRNNSFLAPDMDRVVRQNIGRDATMAFLARPEGRAAATCLSDLYAVGFIDRNTVGCIASDILLYVSLIVILGVVMARFFLALAFGWFMSWQLGKLTESRKRYQMRRTSSWFFGEKMPKIDEAKTTEGGSEATLPPSTPSGSPDRSVDPPDELRSIYTILLVTCYSEGEQSIRTTLDSLATTDYPDRHKLLFVVADGLIKGSGNDKSTPDIIVSMMELDDLHPSAESYVAIADGSKRHNKAKIFTGYYNCEGHRVRMITIVKCGTEAEAQQAKPGNRGKRDSQIVLMDFYSKLIMNDRLSPFQYDLYRKIFRLTGVSPHRFEIVLMVDADTKVMPDSLSRMVACMARDPQVMGLCGETRIANKTASWVTRIQVFEYYISHHLSKAFESIFGGVTCLPGCFCMYRIKAPKRDGYWVPIIANPEIVEQYSENVVDTLHKKNLLLLGEDRYLTTLMLRTFPRRKMLFVPKAMCKTFVPDTLRILLSQRRRWINSTVHNLFELVLVRQLCGTFCFSMQFVVFLELIGTLTLPAAITFTITLLIFTMLNAFKGEPIEWIPLALLAAILGLPAVLILLTTRKMVYIYWMFVYLLSLPVWNFLLPVYAFWHFDDFSWGQTRKVEGAKAADDHGKKEGEFNVRDIAHKTLVEWDMETANLGWDPEMEMYLQKDQMKMRDQDLKGKVKAR
ncbi:chitin synthase-domain-containing protein [Paraphysoderma sedebokerense]|nr:chitin synthase-domain-containing protein [Paraphysoderma sedebokerense]